METEILDKLYLEWSQFTNARTHRERKMFDCIRWLNSMIESGEKHTPASYKAVRDVLDLYFEEV
jgi:hypothetical protein